MQSFKPVDRWNLGHSGYFWFTRRKAMVITHHGIARRDASGQVVIIELKPTGVRRTDFEGFAAGETVFVQDWKPLSAGYDLEVRAGEVLAQRKPFSLLLWNCEHVASRIWHGEPESAQVRGLGTLAVFLLVAIGLGR